MVQGVEANKNIARKSENIAKQARIKIKKHISEVIVSGTNAKSFWIHLFIKNKH